LTYKANNSSCKKGGTEFFESGKFVRRSKKLRQIFRTKIFRSSAKRKFAFIYRGRLAHCQRPKGKI